MNQELEKPDHPVMMVTNRDYRLSSGNGYVVNFKANVPARVPPHVFEEAVGIGAIMAEEQEPPRPPQEEKVIPGAAEAAKLEEEAKIEHIKVACLKLMAEGEPTDFTAENYPKYVKILDLLAPQCPKPTATEVREVFDKLRDDISLAED